MIETKGTDLFVIDPDTGALIEVACVTSIDGIDTAIDQIETTCLSDTARTYVSGLATPGAATFGINTDTSEASHLRLHQLKVAGTTLHWALGWGDGTANPTVDSNDTFNLPSTRSWIIFDGYMNAYPFSFALNAVVTSTVGIQISGDPVLVPKTT